MRGSLLNATDELKYLAVIVHDTARWIVEKIGMKHTYIVFFT